MWLFKRIRRALTDNQGNKVPIIVLSLLGFFCFTRSLCLCIDAYHWRKITPVAFVNVLWGIGQPCLIAAYTLVFIVMRNALTLKQHFQQWYNTRNIAIATHRRTGRGGEGGCSPPKFWATQIFWAARENLGKASF